MVPQSTKYDDISFLWSLNITGIYSLYTISNSLHFEFNNLIDLTQSGSVGIFVILLCIFFVLISVSFWFDLCEWDALTHTYALFDLFPLAVNKATRLTYITVYATTHDEHVLQMYTTKCIYVKEYMLQRNKSVIDGLFNIFSSFKLSVINYTIRRQIEECARYYRITRNLTRNHNRNLWGFIGPHRIFLYIYD